ncbi:MAG TPA: hypothetical protein VIZ18_01360 [Ktedonobacteraceae bacterium]
MPEPKQPKQDKKLSLHPLEFEDALRGLLATEPPPKEKKKSAAKQQRVKESGAKESKE